jgi:hypothetical protein
MRYSSDRTQRRVYFPAESQDHLESILWPASGRDELQPRSPLEELSDDEIGVLVGLVNFALDGFRPVGAEGIIPKVENQTIISHVKPGGIGTSLARLLRPSIPVQSEPFRFASCWRPRTPQYVRR